MHLQKLILENFRNHEKLELAFSQENPVTYIVGPNAQGKTNLLEAIYLLALTKSFRTHNHEDLIDWHKDFARVTGIFGSNSASRNAADTSAPSTHLEIFLGRSPNPPKVLKKNRIKTTGANFLGTCQVVFFHPEDLNMLYLGPDLRRAYLNTLNVQINKNYFTALKNYQKVLRQRNALLYAIKQGTHKKSDLEIWDEQLVENGTLLMSERAKTIDFFNQHITEYYRQISEGGEQVSLSYQHAVGAPAAAQIPVSSLYEQALSQALPRDLQSGHTSVGPHRDEILFLLNNKPLQAHASRGEYRSLILALKLLELKFFEDRTQHKPLLLLDDVFSELDLSRQKMLLQATQTHQTIITTTHLDNWLQDRAHKGLTLNLASAPSVAPLA